MLIGTAGHIDHGKTTLVKALTGVDADRLPEEKARGITLDLGYAYAPPEDGTVLAFVDVPGHEKLIHNMLAGATGIDYVLLVVAADDGPMPQTREHLELIDLLGLTQGAVAITKCDRVEAARVAEVQAEIEQLLIGTGLAGSPQFALSAVSGEGLPALRAHLLAMARQASGLPPLPQAGEGWGVGRAEGYSVRSADSPFRLAIDRAFTLTGIGTVVTGTVHAGRVQLGDQLIVSPPGYKARVKSLRVQDRPAEHGQTGDRCALAISGDFEKSDIARGMWLLAPRAHRPIDRLQAELRVPASQPVLKHWTPVHVHLGSDDILGRVALLDGSEAAPGGRALAEILLDRPTLAVRGDRFVLRDAGAQRSVAGGRVLDIFPPARHKRSPARLALLAALRDDDPATALRVLAEHSPMGVDLAAYAANWNLDEAAAQALWPRAGLRVAAADACGFTAAHWQALVERLLTVLADEHQRAPDMLGVERERLRRMTQPNLARGAFDALVDELLAAGRLSQTRAWLHLPEHAVSVSSADRDLFAIFQPLLDATPYNPPRVRDLARASGTPEDSVRQLFRRMARAGLLYPVAHDHYFSAQAVADLAALVARLCAEHGTLRAASLRDQIGGGRKVAIQILEFFDRTGYTRRVRDEHSLRQAGAAPQWQTP